ncbi:MAG TPA: M48 family metallopeptidase [Phycisphaerales bacterium]|nr:M48 family metallopeptidase [Phycisphaerales bacterium]
MKRLVIVLVASTGMLAGCETNPTTGRSQFNALSRQQELQIGAEAAPQLVSEMGGEVADPALQAYVNEVGQRLVAHTEGDGPQRQWDFTLLDSDVINAFALPGEKVFFSRGLAEKLDNEAQMAAVLGHEVGHVMARHVNDRVAQQLGVGLAGALAGVVLGGATDNNAVKQVAPIAFGVGGQLVLLRYGRGQETEADALGMRYMARAGYDPVGALGVMQVLAEASDGRSGPEMLATHPYPETRIQNIRRLLQSEYASTQGNPNFQVHAERYQQRFLSRLALLPRPERDELALALAALGPSHTWCAHCAAERAAR